MNSSYVGSQGQTSTPIQVRQSESMMSRTGGLLDRLSTSVSRLDAFAGRLCGGTPEGSCTKPAGKEIAASLAAVMDDSNDHLEVSCDRLAALVECLERFA